MLTELEQVFLTFDAVFLLEVYQCVKLGGGDAQHCVVQQVQVDIVVCHVDVVVVSREVGAKILWSHCTLPMACLNPCILEVSHQLTGGWWCTIYWDWLKVGGILCDLMGDFLKWGGVVGI